ncbi:MAG: YkgJ family cysteine cluster protein, partial [Anaerolineales bacterium]|nr:YkgJ family cysteine cluster protein [Anaerolineales bacterium]
RCIQLTDDNRCRIYDQRPDVCRRLRPSREMCGETTEDALRYLAALERATAPQTTKALSGSPSAET